MKFLKYLLIILLFNCSALGAMATKKQLPVLRMEPLFWWTDMKNHELQLMLYGPSISNSDIDFNYPGVSLTRKELTDNPDYIFLYLNIANGTQPGKFILTVKNGKLKQKLIYELKARKNGSADRNSFDESDAVYLLMPDRFVNGNPANDSVPGYFQGVNRNDPAKRHGGDIDGIISKIPYLADLGVTALWTTPLFDNNDKAYSYHHYGCTDYYKIDPRFGKNEDYPRLVDTCHKYGLKTIIDVVPNHCCAQHWWLNNKPAKNWFNEWPEYTSSNYRMTAWTDPHAAQSDLYQLTHGWFAHNMPDLNLNNPLLFDYLRQVYVFWIEYAGIDGMRVDTYPYNDIHVAASFIQSIRNEYPRMNVVGECWVKTPAQIAYFQSGNNNKDGFDSRLTSVMDFCLRDVLNNSFNENNGWESGISAFYMHFAQDFVYPNTDMIMNFLDNHDTDRFSVSVNRNPQKYKMGLAMLIASRGYPQIYYGTEIMLDGKAQSYEGARFDFPGGWPGDKVNAFNQCDRTPVENEIFNYTRTLLQYRKNNVVLRDGKMKQFVPENGIYVFFRYNLTDTIMVIANNNTENKQLILNRYAEMFRNKTKAKDIITGTEYGINKIDISAKTVLILEIH